MPDSTYTMTLKFSQSSISRWGFNITALVASDNSPAGDFSITSNRTQRRTKSVSGKTRVYVEHTSNGTSSTSTNATDWEFKWKAPSSNVGVVKFYAVVNAANGNSNTSGDQIYAKVFDISPSSLLPAATIKSNDTVVCSGQTVSLSGSATQNPTQYSWTIPDGSPSTSTNQNVKTVYSGFGKKMAIMRAKNSYGWGDYDTFYVQVKQSPTAYISGATTRSICPGDSVELIAQFNPNYTYQWSTGETGNKIFAKKAGDYYVNVKSGDCSRTSNSIKVQELSASIPSISSSVSNDSVCKDATITLTGGTGFDSLVWYNNYKELGTTTGNTFQVAVDSGSSYRVRGWNTNGCLSLFSDSIEHVVVPKDEPPTISCVDREPFSVGFEWTGVMSHQGVQVSEDKGKTWIAPSTGTKGNKHLLTGLNPEQDYELWVRAITPAPCYYGEVAKMVCKTGKCSPLDASLTVDTMICQGDEVRVEINGLANESYSLSFDGGAAFTDTIFTFSPQNTGNFTLEITDSAYIGCPPKKFVFPVHIDHIPDLKFRTQRSGNNFCTEDTIEFTATRDMDKYSFYVNDTLKVEQTDSFYFEAQFADGDSAYVIVNKGACEVKSNVIYLSVVPVPDATFSFSRQHSIYSFTPTNTNYKDYFWDFGDGFTSVLMEPDHDYDASSNSTVTVELEVTDNNDCDASSTQDITLPNFSSVEDLAKLGVSIFPSPAHDKLFVRWNNAPEAVSSVTIYTLSGENVAMFDKKGKEFSVDLSNIANGIYILEVQNNDITVRHRLIKN